LRTKRRENVKPFPFFRPKSIGLDGLPFAGQHTEAKGNIAEAGLDEMQTAMPVLDSYMCNCLWPTPVAKRVSIEQIKADIASAREVLANG